MYSNFSFRFSQVNQLPNADLQPPGNTATWVNKSLIFECAEKTTFPWTSADFTTCKTDFLVYTNLQELRIGKNRQLAENATNRVKK